MITKHFAAQRREIYGIACARFCILCCLFFRSETSLYRRMDSAFLLCTDGWAQTAPMQTIRRINTSQYRRRFFSAGIALRVAYDIPSLLLEQPHQIARICVAELVPRFFVKHVGIDAIGTQQRGMLFFVGALRLELS